MNESFEVVAVSPGTGDPSSTRLLADRLAARVAALAAEHGNTVTLTVIELREIAADISTALGAADANDLLIAKPVVLAATAGTARHAPGRRRPDAPDVRLPAHDDGAHRGVRGSEDWGDPALSTRVDRAATEFVLLMESGIAGAIRERSWQSYQHENSLDLDTDLMRLAAGGSEAPMSF